MVFLKSCLSLALMAIPATAASNLLHKDAEKAFTTFPVFSMNLESVLSVTYGFIVKKERVGDGEEMFEVKIKTVTKKADGTTSDLPYPNYPKYKEFQVACAPDSTAWVEVIEPWIQDNLIDQIGRAHV